MKVVKNVLLLIILTCVCSNAFAQDVPTIDAKIIEGSAYKQKDADYEQYMQLIGQLEMDEKNLENLSVQEVGLMKKYDSYYPEGYDDMPTYGWDVLGPGCSWYCGGIYETKVSSHLVSQGANVYTAESLNDDDVRTAWVEGVEGYGIGEHIDFVFDYDAARATTVTISNGYNKDETTWKNNSRVKTLNIYEDDVLLMIVNLADTRDLQTFDLPHPIPNRPDGYNRFAHDDSKQPVVLKMMISDVYKGEKYNDTAISEILFDGLDVHCLLEGSMITMGDNTKLKIEDIKAGQEVLVWNPLKKQIEKQKVVENLLARHAASHIVTLSYKESGDTTISLSLTTDHPLYSPDGWLSVNPQATKNYELYRNENVGKLDSKATLYRLAKGGKGLAEIANIAVEGVSGAANATYNTYTLRLDGNAIFFAEGFAVGQE